MDKQEKALETVANFITCVECNTVPRCFHCGNAYVKDWLHCGDLHTTWRPDCMCISNSGIRIVTGDGID